MLQRNAARETTMERKNVTLLKEEKKGMSFNILIGEGGDTGL